MKFLASTIVLAIAIGWPAAGEARNTKAKSRIGAVTHQYHVQRHAKVRVSRPAPKPCAARTWAGCLGWDPDPNVRMMIQMDAGRDDY
jgi:hypothetical protein